MLGKCKRKPNEADNSRRPLLPSVLVFLKHVLNRRLVNHQIRPALFADHLDAGFVVPLDEAVHFLAVLQHDHHGRPRLHLLLIIEILGVGLLRRSRLPSATSSRRGTVAAVVSSILSTILSTLRTLVPGPALPHGHMIRIMVGVVVAVVMIRAGQCRTNQLAVCKSFLVACRLGRSGIHRFLHSGAPAHALAQTTTSKAP